jgi:hypothetical protein
MLRQSDSKRELISGSTIFELFSGVGQFVPGPKLRPEKLLGFGGAERVLCSDACNWRGCNQTTFSLTLNTLLSTSTFFLSFFLFLFPANVPGQK